MKTTFVATQGGDCECFCWFVTEDVFRAIKGDEAADFELKFHKEWNENHPELKREMRWKIYPGDVTPWPSPGRELRYTVIVEEV